MQPHIEMVRTPRPWTELTTSFPIFQPATKKDIQILRKLWHVGMMVVVVWLYSYVVPSQSLALLLIGTIGGSLVFFDILRLKWKRLNQAAAYVFSPFMRKRELVSITSMSYFLIALFVIVALFPKPIVILSILCLALGDPAACMVGIKFGKDALTKGKTVQGSLACFLVCAFLSFIVLSSYGISSEYLGLICVAVAFSATVTELLTTKLLDDNFTMPIVTAVILYPLLTTFTDFF